MTIAVLYDYRGYRVQGLNGSKESYDMPKKPEQSPYRPVMKAFALMTTISSYIIGAILFGVFGGRWLDQYFGTSGSVLVITLLAALVAAMYGIYTAVKKFTEEEE